jgi:ABC-type transport system substrate-binding protein
LFDRRVRLAANYAIDRQAINEAEILGLSNVTGTTTPRDFDFVLPREPYPYAPARAKQLLKEAGYPNGFDAGEITPNPPFYPFAEATANFLTAVGIKIKVRTVERGLLHLLAREKAASPHPGGQRCLRQRRDADRSLCGDQRELCLRRLCRHRRVIRPTVGRA